MERILEQLRKEARGIANTTAHFMELAERYMGEGKTQWAKASLLLLCEKCDNYEESIEWNGLTEQWQQYRHLVAGLVPPSVCLTSAVPISPMECSMEIEEILSLSEEDLLSALSEHLRMRSANGKALKSLNKWESTVYYADELCAEVNSGGFDSYLYYYGTHFEKAYAALERVSALGVLSILDKVRSKFPKQRIPKSKDAVQDAMDALEEKGIDFEAEDERFYSTGEKELLKCVLAYIKENKTRCR